MTLFEFRTLAKNKLLLSPLCPPEQKDDNTAVFIANQLVRHFLGREYSDSVFDKELPEALCPQLMEALEKKLSGTPLQYIIGEWEFYGLRIFCGKGCLIPRPETEHLAEYLIKQLPCNAVFMDMCTGSGCIPVAVLKNRPDVRCVAVDISQKALDYAIKNAAYHGIDNRIEFVCCDAAQFLPTTNFSAICSNTPYIKSADMENLSGEVLEEPHIALDGGDDGLMFYRIITNRFLSHLDTGGFFAFETGEDTADGVADILQNCGFHASKIADYSGINRIVTGTKTQHTECKNGRNN